MSSLLRRLAVITSLAGVAATGSLLAGAVPYAAAAGSNQIVGPDVSSYQHPGGASINWTRVHRSGASFAIVKATEGTTYVNPYFAKDYAGAGSAGLVRGSYHFARPATPVASSARQQAQMFASAVGETQTAGTLPPALDLEVTGGLSQDQLIRWAQDFLIDMRQLTGRTPLLYTYPSFWSDTIGDAAAFGRFPIWMASYSNTTPTGATLWQFTSTASLKGIKGGVDESRYVGNTTWPWATISDGTQPTAWTPAAPGVPQAVWASLGTSTSTGGTAVVHFLPGDAGTQPISGFTVTSTPGNKHVRVGAGATSATITGLTYGRAYRFTVTASNSVGSGAPSPATNAVTPLLPTAITITSPGVITAGQSVTLTGTLKRADTGQPLVGQTVQLLRKQAGQSQWHPMTSAATDESGMVSFIRRPHKNTAWEFSFPGGSGYGPATAEVTTRVRPRVSAAADATSVPVGRWVHVTGAVAPKASPLKVVRQVKSDSGGWVDTRQHQTIASGSYRFAFRVRAAGTTLTRVRVNPAAGRQPGWSPQIRITAAGS